MRGWIFRVLYAWVHRLGCMGGIKRDSVVTAEADQTLPVCSTHVFSPVELTCTLYSPTGQLFLAAYVRIPGTTAAVDIIHSV